MKNQGSNRGSTPKPLLTRIIPGNVRQNGTCILYLQIRRGKEKQLRHPLDIEIEPEKFDRASQKILGKGKGVTEQNLLLDNVKAHITSIKTKYHMAMEDLTAEQLLHEYLNQGSMDDFVLFFETQITMRENKGMITKSSADSERLSLERLKSFQPKVSFKEVKPSWLEDYESYLRRKRQLQNSTIHNTMKHFRTYFKRAIRDGVKVADPFNGAYKLPTANETKIVWLTLEEVGKLEALLASGVLPKQKSNALRCFLFSCYTGIRYSEYKDVTPYNIEDSKLKILPTKTMRKGRITTIPLSKKALSFLDEDGYLLPDVPSDTAMRDHVKDCVKMCDIKKNVGLHVARHTFGSNWILAGRNLVALKKMLGHQKLEYTMIYVHLHANDLQEEMDKYEDWCN